METLSYFFIFFARYSVKLGEDFGRYSRVFGDKNLKPVEVSLKPGTVYPQKHVNTTKSSPSFTEYRAKKIKKYESVSIETLL